MMLALYIVAGIVFFVPLVLSIPVDMAFDVGGPGAGKSRIRVGWLFGLFGNDLGGRRNKPEERAPKGETKKRSAKPSLSSFLTKGAAEGLLKLSKGIPGGVMVRHLDTRLMIGLLKLSRRILAGVKVRHLDARLVIGLDNPADTGMLYAALHPVLVPLTYNSSAKVQMELSFEEPALDLTARGRIRVFPIQVVWYVLLFALTLAGMGLMKRMVVRR